MMIKFPSHINPARITVSLVRVDEVVPSPLTNVQQVLARGNPVWKWNYEYVDLSESERDIVQAFLMKCRGAVNTFKVTDPADYEIKGSISNWIDVFSGFGSFNVTAGSGTSKVNSWFDHAARFVSHITEEQMVRFEWRTDTSAGNLQWRGHGGGSGIVNSLEIGKAYLHRIKLFNLNNTAVSFSVGSDTSDFYYLQSAPNDTSSDGIISVPFVTDVNTVRARVVNWNVLGTNIGDHFEHADYRLARCALVSNSENLLTRSNEFDHADWSPFMINVDSGYGDASPTGVTSGAWKLYVDASVNTIHTISQAFTKINTEDMYTHAIYARASELDIIELSIVSAAGEENFAKFYLDPSSGNAGPVTNDGTHIRGFAKMWDVGSDWFRCQMSGIVSSNSQLTSFVRLADTAGNTQFTGNGSDGIEIFGGQLRKFPFMGQYVPTVASAIVGTDSQTGSQLYVDGLDSEDIIKSGQRFELLNQLSNVDSNHFERSEFKRITKELRVHREGYVELNFDPPIRNAPETNRSWQQSGHLGETIHNPVIFHQPEMKVRLINGTIIYTDKSLKATDLNFDIIEDMTE